MIDFGEHVGERKGLDLTPMLDVVFLLLIFFLLTSIFSKPLLSLDLPEAASSLLAPEPEIVVSIHRNGKLHLNEERVHLHELSYELSGLLATRNSRDISLRAHQGVPFGQVVEVMDAAKQAGADNIAIVTERKP